MRKLYLQCLLLCVLGAGSSRATEAAAAAGTAPPTTQGALNLESGFVTAAGSQFVLDGQPFYFQGSNFYRLGIVDRQTDAEVYDIMRQYSGRGIKVVRIWGFSCGDQSKQAMLQSVNKDGAVYDQGAMHRLDLAIDAARTYGIKIILPLVNYQAEYCPMSWWVKQVTGDSDQHRFYSDALVRDAFKRHISTILRRENSVYQERRGEHRAYADDPTIMAIELSNELHTDENYEINRGGRPGDLVYHWLAEMSLLVRDLDKHHLIASGEEGYKVSASTEEESSQHQWLSNGSKGVDFVRNLSLPNIDFATIHIYPGNWGIPSTQLDWLLGHYIADRGAIAHAAGKPIVLEEAGFSFRDNEYLGYLENPGKFLALMYKAANKSGYAGTMAWQLVPPGSEIGDYIFDFNSQVAASIFQQVDVMNMRATGS